MGVRGDLKRRPEEEVKVRVGEDLLDERMNFFAVLRWLLLVLLLLVLLLLLFI